MSDTDALKSQAESALKRLEEARLHERCPKACKACSQKHRKCQFKTGQYPKCDLCAKNNRDCEIIPTPMTLAGRRKSDDTVGTPTSQAQQYAYPGGSPPELNERSYRTSPSTYSSNSSSASPVDIRHPGGHSSSYPYQQGGANQYAPSTSGAQLSHSSGYSSLQAQQGHYSQHAPGFGQTHQHTPSPTMYDSAQGRGQSPYYVSAQTSITASPSSFVPSSAQWSEGHGVPTQSAAPVIGQSYGYPASTHSGSLIRQASVPTVSHIHTSTDQPYARTAHAYQTASPASQGGSYAVAGNPMYQLPQHSSARYGSGQVYNQSLNSAPSGSTNGAAYYHSMHQ